MTAYGPRSMRKMTPQGKPRGRAKCHCGKQARGQGLCSLHYQQAKRDGTIKIVQPHRRMRDVPITEEKQARGLTREELRDDMSGERCRCGLRLPCNDCLPKTAAEFVAKRMTATSNWVIGPLTGEE